MTEYAFLARFIEQPSRALAARIEMVAMRHRAHFIEANVREGASPGINNGRYMAWFEARNRGEPFDSECRRRVLDDLRAAKLIR